MAPFFGVRLVGAGCEASVGAALGTRRASPPNSGTCSFSLLFTSTNKQETRPFSSLLSSKVLGGDLVLETSHRGTEREVARAADTFEYRFSFRSKHRPPQKVSISSALIGSAFQSVPHPHG